MAVPVFDFTTGVATLPDVGTLSYNGCVFSPLFVTQVSGTAVKDEARRTTMYMEYVITVDGYVTMPRGQSAENGGSIRTTMATMRRLLSAQGGVLIYRGRGCDIVVNAGANTRDDVAWGPVPEVLEFQPLGGELSAKVQWRVTTRITEISATKDFTSGLTGGMLQFNYETLVGYGEDGYSNISVRGVLEIPLTRTPNQQTRTLTQTADSFREQIELRIMKGIDLERFRVTRRSFNLSRDKRVLTWDIGAEEKPYMDLPPGCNVARGTYSVRPAKVGMGLVTWLCTLRASYTVRHDMPRRVAWLAFLMLLRLRMGAANNAPELVVKGEQNPGRGVGQAAAFGLALGLVGAGGNALLQLWRNMLNSQDKVIKGSNKPFLIDFSIDEGLYLDSKTSTFSATWKLVTPFSHILLASGIWTKVTEKDVANKNLWAISMRDVQGAQSWLRNPVDAKLDVIVDFGGS